MPSIYSSRNSNITKNTNNPYSNNVNRNNQNDRNRNRNNNNNWGNHEPNGNYVLTNNIYYSPRPIVGGYQNRKDNMVMKIGSRHDPTYSKYRY